MEPRGVAREGCCRRTFMGRASWTGISRLPYFLTAGRNVEAPRQNRVSRKRLENMEKQRFVRTEPALRPSGILRTLRGRRASKDEALIRGLPFSPHPPEPR